MTTYTYRQNREHSVTGACACHSSASEQQSNKCPFVSKILHPPRCGSRCIYLGQIEGVFHCTLSLLTISTSVIHGSMFMSVPFVDSDDDGVLSCTYIVVGPTGVGQQ